LAVKRKFIPTTILLLVLLGLPLLGWRMFLAHVINQQLAEIRAAGLPTNGEELNRWYAPVPDNQNAALVLTQAFDLRRNYSDSRSNLIHNYKLPKRGVALTSEQAELLKGYIAMNKECLRKTDEALQLPASRYPIDCSRLMYTPLPHLSWLKSIALMHQYSAILEMESGNAPVATSHIMTTLALSHTLDREPSLISQFVRFALVNMAFTTLERRANAGTLREDEIALLAGAFSKTTVTNTTAQAMIGERARTLPYFRITKDELAKIRPPTDESDPAKNSPVPCYGPTILRWIGYYELDYGSYLIGMSKGIALLSDPAPENLRASGYFARVGEGSKLRHRTLSAQTLSACASAVLRENDVVANQRLALTALALESFRNTNGRLPEQLDELVSKFLEEIPEDPFLGVELEYRRTEKGYLIYSVGRDREDNGGLEQSDKKSCDITFTVER